MPICNVCGAEVTKDQAAKFNWMCPDCARTTNIVKKVIGNTFFVLTGILGCISFILFIVWNFLHTYLTPDWDTALTFMTIIFVIFTFIFYFMGCIGSESKTKREKSLS